MLEDEKMAPDDVVELADDVGVVLEDDVEMVREDEEIAPDEVVELANDVRVVLEGVKVISDGITAVYDLT